MLSGGTGGARFLRGLRSAYPEADITVVANTGDDIWLFGLKVCPDLDTVMYTLGGGIHEGQGWGRADETFSVKAELAAYGAQPQWFGLGDRDLATHLVRREMLDAGYPLSAVTAALCTRWQPGVTLLPMSDDRTETHVVIDDPDTGPQARKAIHFQEWWIKHRAALTAHDFVLVGAETARPGPGVVEAIRGADVVILPPSNPVVSVGTILSVPGIREALRSTDAPIVGVSPIVAGRPLRGMADACLAAIGVQTTARAVAEHYGARHRSVGHQLGSSGAGVLDGWVVDSSDSDAVEPLEALGMAARAVPAIMSDVDTAAALARETMALAEQVSRDWRSVSAPGDLRLGL